MTNQEVQRLGSELQEEGHALTSFQQLGISDFETLASQVCRAVEKNDQLKAERRAQRLGMVMCKDTTSKQAGARMIVPVVEALFEIDDSGPDAWVPYTVNHYETGEFFSPHQDYLDGTVIIVGVLGVRGLDVYRKEEEDDIFIEVEHRYILKPGSILLLNGYKDLGHAAQCVKGPSISVVGDVPVSIPGAK